jgi:glycolate dehydrogenase FAD-binding subunit
LSIGTLISGLLPDGQVLEGFRAEPWAVCDRVPEAVAFPETDDEVASVLCMARTHGWTCVPAGKGTWLDGGQPPSRIDVVMSLTRMDRVLEYEPADLNLTAEAGVGLDLLSKRTEPHMQWLPLDPPGLPRGTLGATVVTGSAGPLQAGYGVPRDHVLGATLVRPDGTVLRFGGRVVKNVAGFDLLKLVAGSWGTLGVVTSLTVRLHPRPAADRSVLFSGAGDAPLVELARGLARLPVSLAALDLLVPGDAERMGTGATPLVVARLMGSRDEVDEVQRMVEAVGPESPERVLEGEHSARLYQNVQAVEEGAELVIRLRMLPSRLTRTLEIAEEARAIVEPNRGFGMRLAGYVQAGLLRVIISRVARGDDWLERAGTVVSGMRDAVESDGGSLIISRGPPELLQAVGAWGASGSERALVEGVKSVFDAEALLSPGRLGVV